METDRNTTSYNPKPQTLNPKPYAGRSRMERNLDKHFNHQTKAGSSQ